MPILKLTGGKTISVSQRKAEEIIRWKTERVFDPSKLVDVGSDNYLAMSEIKGVLADEDFIRGAQDKKIDLNDPNQREMVRTFEANLGGLGFYKWAIQKGIIFDKTKKVDGHDIFNYSVNIERHVEWTECLKLWSALQDLILRREVAQRNENERNTSLAKSIDSLQEKMKS